MLFNSLFFERSFSYDDERTHRQLTQRTTDASTFSSILKNHLGFPNGASSILNDRTIGWWLREGSYIEDTPTCRASNHFHNPLKPWDQAFMTDDNTPLGFLIRQYCNLDGWPYSDRKSALSWGTGYLSPSGPPINRARQEMGWDHARKYYYAALTSLSKSDQDASFVKAFQALGQVLHLLQDMTVPAHVRNDFTSHLIFQGFESISPVTWLSNPYEYYVKNHAALVNASEGNFAGLTNPRITDFWDADIYTGGAELGESPIGLAEITNARYFSDSTIPGNGPRLEHSFPFPAVNSLNAQICEDYSEDLTEVIKYISRRSKGPCPALSEARTADHFAVISMINESVITEANISSLKLLLDENVHQTYAQELIPRAIGYSAGLLDYFFRGKIQVTAIPIFYRGSLHFMRLKIKNLAEETMTQGEFALTYRYTPPGGDADGANDIFKPAWPVGSNSALAPCVELRGQQEMVVDFQMDSPLFRNDYEALKFTLAYKGNLGNEAGAVIGKTFNPGRVIFEEEWDNPLPGNYVWAHTDFNLNSYNPDNGSTINQVDGNYLTKENIRNAGSGLARINESFLGYDGFPGPFPLPITPNTYLMYKIDEMSMNPLGVGYQIMLLSFTDKFSLQISQPGQMVYWNDKTAYYTFTPGYIIVDNIYESFQRAGFLLPEGSQINFLSLDQHLNALTNPTATENFQRTEVDFIQIVEANVE